jgi:hypothetical protein
MIEICLVAIIFFLLLHNFAIQKQYLSHLKELEAKVLGIELEGKVATPNEIAENPYRDISEVSPNEIIK